MRTHLGWTRVPPQKASLYLLSSATYYQYYYYHYHCYNYRPLTCHGHRPGLASVPPMILSAMAIRSPGSWRLEWVCLVQITDNITSDNIIVSPVPGAALVPVPAHPGHGCPGTSRGPRHCVLVLDTNIISLHW